MQSESLTNVEVWGHERGHIADTWQLALSQIHVLIDQMTELARTIHGGSLVSANDIPEMRRAFAGLAMERVEIGYSVGGAGRQPKRSGELIIRSW